MAEPGNSSINWEAFYGNFRKPGYIPGFEILEKLGAGVFGLVYKARKESIGKLYAIKFLKVDDESVREAVVRELDSVRFFAQVDHPNLVAIEDKGEVDGIPYIVMAYAGDSSLRRLLDTEGLNREQALSIFVQIARGLQALHERSLVHFDLKPANIYLKGSVARIGDYGLSKLVSQTRNSLSFGRGTPHYMAPEMLTRHGDHRSDIYSLGILLYEMLVGKPPFKGDSEWELLRKHEQESPSYPRDLDPGDQRVIAGCLAKDPEARFQSVEEMLAQLQGAAEVPLAHSTEAMSRPAAQGAGMAAAMPPAEPRRPADELPRQAHSASGPARRRRRSPIARIVFLLVLVGLAASSLNYFRNGKWKRLGSHLSQSSVSIRDASAPRAMVDARRVSQAIPYPKDVRYGLRKQLEQLTADLRNSNRSTQRAIRQHLERIGECKAIPALVNKMASLDFARSGEAEYAYLLNTMLKELTGIESNLRLDKSRVSKSRDRTRARRNNLQASKRAVQEWTKYYDKTHGSTKSKGKSGSSVWGR